MSTLLYIYKDSLYTVLKKGRVTMSLNTNKKSIFIFILLTLLGGLVGACSVIFSKYFDLSSINPSENWFLVIFYVGCLVSTVGIILTIISMIKIKSTLKNNNDIDEYSLDNKTHTNLTVVLSVSTLLNVFTIGWVSVLLIYVEKLPSVEFKLIGYILISALLAIVSAILPILSFNFYNRIYKSRQLDVLSQSISKDAFNKLDECEKTIAYKGAFKSFKVLDGLMFLTIVCLMILGLLLSIDTILPIVIVTTLLLVSKTVYFIEVYKLEKSN